MRERFHGGGPVRSSVTGRGWLRIAAVSFFLLAAGAPCQLLAEVPEQFLVRGGRAKEHPYLVQTGAAPVGLKEVDSSEAEAARGFILFSRPVFASVSPEGIFGPADRCTVLEARDCPGQYGRLTFALLALQQGDFAMKVTDLVDGAGSAIEADNLELRAVRWVKVAGKEGAEAVPLLLERFERETVPAGQVQQFWVTYYVPEDARPGTYEGQVHITVGGEEKLALPLRLRVNPFRLVGARIGLAGARVDTYIYYSHSASPEELGLVYKELVDQRCHGMNTGTLSPPVTRSGEVSREAMAALLDVYKSARFASRRVHVELWNRIASEWLNQPDRTIGMWGPWFRYYPASEELDARYVATVRMIKEEAEKRGLELVLSVADEPGSHPWTTGAAQHYNDLVKAQVPGVLRELTVGGGWAMGRREEELWRGRINIWTSNRWLPEEFAKVRRDGPQARIALYNMAGGGSGPGGPETARLFYGFYCWKTKAAGVSQWVYYHDATPADNYVWPAQDASEGRVPTVRWEAVREGVKDRLYLATLEDLLTGRADKDADRARKLLDEIAWAIALEPPASESGGGRVRLHPAGTYDAWRERIMDAIEALGVPTTKR